MSSQEDEETSGFEDSLHRIEAKWNEFEAQVVPVNAGAIQRHEMKLAFYGGAAAMFNLILTASGQTQGAAMVVMSELQAELSRYAGAVHKTSGLH